MGFLPTKKKKSQKVKNHCKHGHALSTKRLLSYFKEIRVSAFGVSVIVMHPIPEKRQSATFPVCLPPPLLHASCTLALSVQLLSARAFSSGRLAAAGPDTLFPFGLLAHFKWWWQVVFFLLPTVRNDRKVYLNICICHANDWHMLTKHIEIWLCWCIKTAEQGLIVASVKPDICPQDSGCSVSDCASGLRCSGNICALRKSILSSSDMECSFWSNTWRTEVGQCSSHHPLKKVSQDWKIYGRYSIRRQ